jgi:pimeloyl-ACP methyl ester carboxylesterase
MSAITIDDDLVHYEVLGRGRPVILLHSWLGSWRYWVPTMQQLAVKYRCYAVDLWGFGDSAKDPNRYTLERQASLIDQFMQRMGIPRVVLVGHGLGAILAAYFAALPQYSSKVHRMLVIAPPLFEGAPSRTPRPLTANALPAGQAGHKPLPASMIDESLQPAVVPIPGDGKIVARSAEWSPTSAAERITLVPNPLKEIFAQNSLEDLLKKAVAPNSLDYDKLKLEITKTDQKAVLRSIESLNDINPLRDILAVNTGTCVVLGSSDGLIPFPSDPVLDQLDERQALKLMVLPNVYHYPMLEDNAQFVRLLKEFLEAADISALETKEEWRRRKR